MKIAIIGMGEVGRCYAKALHGAGYELELCDPRPSTQAAEMAINWALPVHQSIDTWITGNKWIISCVTGSHAFGVVEQCLAYAKAESVICDMTTASPDVKRAASQLCSNRSVGYLDIAIMGAISLNLERTPLLASGTGAADFAALLAKANGVVKTIPDGKAGDAMALKILRSVFTKGLEALSVELLMAAEQQGIREKLYEQLKDIDETPLRTFIEMLVRTHVIHARRRAHEVLDASAELSKHGLPSAVLPGVSRRFEATIAGLDLSPPSHSEPSVEQALQWLLNTESAVRVSASPSGDADSAPTRHLS